MIYVTGGAGFIGSAVIWELNRRNRNDIIVVDHLRSDDQWKNLRNLEFIDFLDKQTFIEQIRNDNISVNTDCIFHLGACSSTTEMDMGYLLENNFHYTRDLALWSNRNDVRFIYASSAATYGDGNQGFRDDQEHLSDLKPLNPYAYSKQLFDQFAQKKGLLKEIAGLKYFNVYGPNEYHKGEMRSVVNKSFPQARDQNLIRLFKSHRDDYRDGQQKRDFLYVKDAAKMTLFFWKNPDVSGIFNIGTGHARTFDDLAEAIFSAIDKKSSVEYFDMPEEIRSNYQYFTEATIDKLRNSGYDHELYSLEKGIQDYVKNYLIPEDSYLSP